MFHSITIDELPLLPEGKIFKVTVGCRVYHIADKLFLASWVERYIKDPDKARIEWDELYSTLIHAQQDNRPIGMPETTTTS